MVLIARLQAKRLFAQLSHRNQNGTSESSNDAFLGLFKEASAFLFLIDRDINLAPSLLTFSQADSQYSTPSTFKLPL
jgi:hypothetical protein